MDYLLIIFVFGRKALHEESSDIMREFSVIGTSIEEEKHSIGDVFIIAAVSYF